MWSWSTGVHIWVYFGNSRMQIDKKWLNQLKNFFNKHFKEYYLASFCWWIPSSCENHCNLMVTCTYNVQEAHEKGAVLYLLDMFCNNDTPGLRERTAEVSHTYVLFRIFHPFKSLTYTEWKVATNIRCWTLLIIKSFNLAKKCDYLLPSVEGSLRLIYPFRLLKV